LAVLPAVFQSRAGCLLLKGDGVMPNGRYLPLDVGHQVLHGLFGIAEEHHGVIPEKEFVFNTNKSGFHDLTQPAWPATGIDLSVD
jgi:hypothetical protein